MKKSTSAMLRELNKCECFQRYHDKNKYQFINTTLSEELNRLLAEKDLKKAKVIRDSELSEIYGYQIFSGVRKPERNKLLSLCLAMHLTIEEVQKLLKICGYAQLYVKNEADCIILYGFLKGKSVIEVNQLLFEAGIPTLG